MSQPSSSTFVHIAMTSMDVSCSTHLGSVPRGDGEGVTERCSTDWRRTELWNWAGGRLEPDRRRGDFWGRRADHSAHSLSEILDCIPGRYSASHDDNLVGDPGLVPAFRGLLVAGRGRWSVDASFWTESTVHQILVTLGRCSGSWDRSTAMRLEGLPGWGEIPWKAGNTGWKVERVEGIEPSTKAWEAFVLPLNYTRITILLYSPKRAVQ